MFPDNLIERITTVGVCNDNDTIMIINGVEWHQNNQ